MFSIEERMNRGIILYNTVFYWNLKFWISIAFDTIVCRFHAQYRVLGCNNTRTNIDNVIVYYWANTIPIMEPDSYALIVLNAIQNKKLELSKLFNILSNNLLETK